MQNSNYVEPEMEIVFFNIDEDVVTASKGKSQMVDDTNVVVPSSVNEF